MNRDVEHANRTDWSGDDDYLTDDEPGTGLIWAVPLVFIVGTLVICLGALGVYHTIQFFRHHPAVFACVWYPAMFAIGWRIGRPVKR